VIRTRPRRVTRGAMSTKREVTPEPASAQRSPLASGSVRFASISSEARSVWLRRCSRSCWSPSLARSRSCSCSSPRSPGGAARRAGTSACSARSPMTAPGAPVPVANRLLSRRHRSRRKQGAGERRQAPVRAYANHQDRRQLGKRSAEPRCSPILARRFWSRQGAAVRSRVPEWRQSGSLPGALVSGHLRSQPLRSTRPMSACQRCEAARRSSRRRLCASLPRSSLVVLCEHADDRRRGVP
jgi:hypothetical protein